MSYQDVASISQVSSLLLFIGLFVAVLVYVLWPGNKARFDDIQKSALELDKKTPRDGAN